MQVHFIRIDSTRLNKIIINSAILRCIERMQFFKAESVDVVLRRVNERKNVVFKRFGRA